MQTQNESLTTNATPTLPVELSITFSPEYMTQLKNDGHFLQDYHLVAGDNVTIKQDNVTGKLTISSTDTLGAQGPRGQAGPMPAHQWNGTQLFFELPEGGWGAPVELVGATGLSGANGTDGATYIPVVSQPLADKMTLSWLSPSPNAPVVTPTTITLPVNSVATDAKIAELEARISALENKLNP